MPTSKPTPAPEGALESFDTLGQVEAWLVTPGYVIPWPEVDPETAAADIAKRIIDGEGDPLAPDGGSALGLDDVVGTSWRLLEISFRPSDPMSGAPEGSAYALLRGADANGEAVVLATGSRKVLARCVAMAKQKQLGRWVKIIRPSDAQGKTRGGRDFYDLVSGDDGAPFPDA